ncbi:MAG: diguanylate cyclase [Oscillospiraceae bacterium]|jgi:diguanylate cyclase (GGDEF)-like protein|nr:diguanylate cyclase [Oscillospiraceae bacterium]
MKTAHRRNNKMAIRVSLLNMIIIVCILVAIIVAASIMMSDVAGVASERLAYIHAMEALGKFNAHARYDLALIRQVATSNTIQEWFYDEHNEDKMHDAFKELMNYTPMLQSREIYFGIYGSLNEFSIDDFTTFEEFAPYGSMKRGEPMDAWFFDIIDSDYDYLFNIDIDKVEGRWRIWINYKVVKDEQVIGVICTSIRIDDVLYYMFGSYFESGMRGLIVDRFGIIHMDSISYEHYGDTIDDAIYVGDIDPALDEFLSSYINRNERFFAESLITDIISLEDDYYNYAVIAPIANSDWKIVVLFSEDILFSVSTLLPIVVVVSSSLLLYMALITIVTRRFVLNPLKYLTESISQISASESTAIYGHERDDEIGSLSKTISKAQNELRHREALLNTVNNAAVLLMSVVDYESYKDALVKSMKMIGTCLDADRVQLWRVDFSSDGTRLSIISQWLSELGQHYPQFEMDDIVPAGVLDDFKKMFFGGVRINGPVSNLPPEDQRFLNPHNSIKSIVIIPLMLDGKVWGIFSTDDCVNERLLSDKEMDIMHSAGSMFVGTYSRIVQSELAITDALTGIRNRRYFNEASDRLIKSLSRSMAPLIIMMVDIDYFKEYNDSYGHSAGDDCLVAIANALAKGVSRSDDFVARFGGEEFVIVLPYTNEKSAQSIAEKMLVSIRDLNIPHRQSSVADHVTISIGIATGRVTYNKTINQFIKRADEMLYKSKQDGRNRYSI